MYTGNEGSGIGILPFFLPLCFQGLLIIFVYMDEKFI